MATTISRTWYDTLQDDSGSGTDGTIIDKADFDAILDAIDALLAAGSLSLGGALAISGALTGATTGAFSGAISANGGQVAFPSTQVPSAVANTLDDYEEGTFTPALKFGGATTGITYAVQSGVYVKIGRNVFFNIVLALSSKGSATGDATITGVPFANTDSASPPAHVFAYGLAAGTYTNGAYLSGSTLALFNVSAGSATALTDAAVTNTTEINIGGWCRASG